MVLDKTAQSRALKHNVGQRGTNLFLYSTFLAAQAALATEQQRNISEQKWTIECTAIHTFPVLTASLAAE